MRNRALVLVLALVLGSTPSAMAAPPAKPASPVAPAVTTRVPVANELLELTRTAITATPVRLPKGATVVAARPAVSGNVMIPIAPSRVTIDVTTPTRKAGPVATSAVLVFWKGAEIAARLPLRLELSVPPEALVYDVPKGGSVMLVVRRGLVEVSAPAVTSADADIGDVVQVLLRPSGRVMRAQIVARDRAIAVEDGK